MTTTPKKLRNVTGDHYSDKESEALEKVLREIVAAQVPSLGGKLPTPPKRPR